MDRNIEFLKITKKDLDFITNLYNYYVLHTTSTFHINKQSQQEVWNYFQIENDLVDAFIIQDNGIPIGFCVFKPHNMKKEGYKYTYEPSIFLDKNYTKKGIGTETVKYMENIGQKKQIVNIVVRICSENVGSERLWLKCGYKTCGKFENVGFKFDRWLSVVFFQKRFEK